MRFNPRRKIVVGALALAACSFGGGAYAATQDNSSSTPQAFLNDVARRLGVTPQRLSSAFDGALTDQLNAAVKAGKLTQAQASAIEQRLRAHGFVPFGPLLGPPAFIHPRSFRPGGPVLGAAAKYLGITTAQLRSELRSGKTLKQIASEHGKSVAGLEQAIRSALPRLVPPRLWRRFRGNVRPVPFGPPPAGFGLQVPVPPAAS
jgi:hypothetical protein